MAALKLNLKPECILHKHTFRYPNKSNLTELSKFDWKPLDAGNQATVALTFEKKFFTSQCSGKKYDLCFAEKSARLQANKMPPLTNVRKSIQNAEVLPNSDYAAFNLNTFVLILMLLNFYYFCLLCHKHQSWFIVIRISTVRFLHVRFVKITGFVLTCCH